MTQSCDIAIIGAGPSGAVAAALLLKHGFSVCVLEKQHFPRFVIGESLLPHCMEFIEEAGFLPAVEAEPSFQFKNGAPSPGAAATPISTSPTNSPPAPAPPTKCAAESSIKS